MKSISTSYIFLSILFLAIIGGLFFMWSNRTDWEETYNKNSDQPYGTDVISKLLESKDPGTFHSIERLGDSTLHHFTDNKKKNYVFIGQDYYADKNDVKDLLEFVGQGNNAFLSSNSFPDEITGLFETKYADTTDESVEYVYIDIIKHRRDSVAHLNFTGNFENKDDFTLRYNSEGFQIPYQWNYIDSSIFENDYNYIFVLGTMNKRVNFVRVEYGRGNFFLHLTPLAFTNYAVVDKIGRNYAERCFSVLNEGDIIWDEYNKLPKYNHSANGAGQSASPFKFILSRESLRWAWYSTLLLLIIYAVFIGKRRQRIIPVIEGKKNTTLEYVKTVGKLYYLERNNRSVCVHKMKHFQSFLRNRYFILTNQRNQEMIDKLSMVSGVNKELVNDIYNQFALINTATDLSDDELIKFHVSLTRFYNECI